MSCLHNNIERQQSVITTHILGWLSCYTGPPPPSPSPTHRTRAPILICNDRNIVTLSFAQVLMFCFRTCFVLEPRCGMPTEATERAAREDSAWMVTGRYGCIQLFDPATDWIDLMKKPTQTILSQELCCDSGRQTMPFCFVQVERGTVALVGCCVIRWSFLFSFSSLFSCCVWRFLPHFPRCFGVSSTLSPSHGGLTFPRFWFRRCNKSPPRCCRLGLQCPQHGLKGAWKILKSSIGVNH